MSTFSSERTDVTSQTFSFSDFASVVSAVNTIQSEIDALSADIIDSQSNISSLQSEIGVLNADFINAQSDISSLQSDKASLSGATFTGEVDVVSAISLGSTSVRQITYSSVEPTSGDGNDGDIWLVLE